jgi:hypothetical protein
MSRDFWRIQHVRRNLLTSQGVAILRSLGLMPLYARYNRFPGTSRTFPVSPAIGYEGKQLGCKPILQSYNAPSRPLRAHRQTAFAL